MNNSESQSSCLLYLYLRLGRFLQAVVEERPTEESDMSVPTERVFGSSGEGRFTPLHLNWEELTYSKVGVKIYEHSGAKPTPHSTFKLRYEISDFSSRPEIVPFKLLFFCLFCFFICFFFFILSLCRPEQDPGATVSEGLDSAETVQKFAATLVPLLLEVWVEASTNDSPWNNTEGAHLLTPDAMSVMFQVLSILQLLRKLAPQRENQDALVRCDLHVFCFCFVFSFYFNVNV